MSEQKKSKFNENQGRAVFTSDKDILVSAGAGCGKTFVMIERIAENIISRKVSVDELLVVTYTNAAAAEMRVKLANKINELLADPSLDIEEKNYLNEQGDLIGQSDICTLHKFCQNLIGKYFFVLDLDPSCEIVEEAQANIIKSRAINEVIEELVMAGDEEFNLLANTFDDKRGYDKICEYVYKIYEFLNNQPDIVKFKEKVNSAYNDDLAQNQFAKTINNSVVEMFEHYLSAFEVLRIECVRGGFDRLVEVVENYVRQLGAVKKDNTFEQNHQVVFNINLPKLPQKRKGDTPEFEYMLARVRELRKDFADSNGGALNKIRAVYVTDDIEQLKADLLGSQKIVNAMFSLVERFGERFMKLKKEQNLMDFSDLEKYAYKILQNPQVGAEIRVKYKQIYVDEYQDVNDIQEGILSQIHKSRDIFLVGDVKQSIYGFRNTNPQIFLDKLYSFGDEKNDEAEAIPLNENYRSDQRVLDYVNYVFERLMTKEFAGIEYNNGHAMRSGADYKVVENQMPIVEVMVINKTKEEAEKVVPSGVYRVSEAKRKDDIERSYAKAEAYAIYNKILELMSTQKQIYDAKKKKFRDIEFGDITILARSRTGGVPEILGELSALGLPMMPLSGESVEGEYEVQILLNYLKLVDDMADDISLTSLLVSPMIGLDEVELSKIRLGNMEAKNFFECVKSYSKDDEIRRKIDYLYSLIDAGRRGLIGGTVYEILNAFVDKTNYIELICACDDGLERMARIHGFINSFLGKSYNYDLSMYLNILDKNTEKQNIAKEPNSGASVIGFATMHQSKGLEYPIVFMVDCGHQYNNMDKRGDFLLSSELGIGMQVYDRKNRVKRKTILHSAVNLATKDKDLAERERLLYVAMTRAKNHLYITGALNMEKFKGQKTAYALKNVQNDLSLILSSVPEGDLETLKSVHGLTTKLGENNVIEYSLLEAESAGAVEEVKQANEPQQAQINPEIVEKIKENLGYSYPHAFSTGLNLKHSVTALNKLENEHRIKVSEDSNVFVAEDKKERVETREGIAYHKAMEVVDFNLSSFEEISQHLARNLSKDELSLIDCGKIVRAVENLRPMIQGAKIYREQPFLLKAPISSIVAMPTQDEVFVEGIIDLIIKKGEEAIVIDYKTSGAKDVEERAKDYQTQLKIYAKAVESALNCKVRQKFLYFFLQERLILIDNE